jgi:arabinose-5-phosphate isomerase
MKSANYQTFGQAVITIEAKAISDLKKNIDENFSKACEILLNHPERVIVMGMGKSSYIGGKIAATLASTGTPAFFVHPGEASHGDLGMITQKDVVIAISNSGETPEILTLLPLIKHLKVPLISLTGNTQSTLAKAAEVNVDVSVSEEACPLGLAPTSSTTAALVMGDALAITLLQARGFTAVDFARSHPGGRLGKRLLLKVSDLMKSGDSMPIVNETVTVSEALMEMSKKSLGMTMVVDAKNKLLGIYTDGDLRRTLDKNLDIRTTSVQKVMSVNPKNIRSDKLAVEALRIMEDFLITALVVVDDKQNPLGVIHMHDLLKAGVA